jgi:hypothetical protein
MGIYIFRIFTDKIYYTLQWNIFYIFSLVSCPTIFILIQPIHKIYIWGSISNFDVKKDKNVYNKQKIQVLFIKTGLIYFHLVIWKLSNFTRGYRHPWTIYFHTTTMKINPAFIEKLNYPLLKQENSMYELNE